MLKALACWYLAPKTFSFGYISGCREVATWPVFSWQRGLFKVQANRWLRLATEYFVVTPWEIFTLLCFFSFLQSFTLLPGISMRDNTCQVLQLYVWTTLAQHLHELISILINVHAIRIPTWISRGSGACSCGSPSLEWAHAVFDARVRRKLGKQASQKHCSCGLHKAGIVSKRNFYVLCWSIATVWPKSVCAAYNCDIAQEV